jgi:hypothetical protein
VDPIEAVAALAAEELHVGAMFQARWDKGTGAYTDAGALATALVDQAIAVRIDVVAPVFAALERMLTSANQDVRKVLIVGLIEGIQNVSLNRNIPLEDWHVQLGPVTRGAWDVVEDFWQGRISADAFNQFVGDR